METSKKYPLFAVILILLACVDFEYHSETLDFTIPGLAGALGVIAIIGIVLMFRIFNAVEYYCLRKKLLRSKLYYRYDKLILATIVAVSLHYRFVGPEMTPQDEEFNPQWIFRWSGDLAVYFILAVIGLVLLLRILTLVRHLELTPDTEQE